jgi:hypothetical protein
MSGFGVKESINEKGSTILAHRQGKRDKGKKER